MEASELTAYFIQQIEVAKNLEELDKVAAEIKEAVELLRCYYISNKLKFTAQGRPEDILKKGVL